MPSTRVLVADDAVHLALYLQHMLRKAGYEARVVNRAEQIQAAIEDYRPAALLLNVEMSGRSGLDICRSLRSDARNAALVIVFVTGRIFESGAKEIAASGVNGILLKPVSLGALVGKLHELGLSPDMSKPGVRETGSGPILPFANVDGLSVLERFKIELVLTLNPLVEALRVGAFLTTASERGWLSKPQGCHWPDPGDLQKPGENLHVSQELVTMDGEHVCTVYLCTDGNVATALAPAAALVKQIQRVVELGKQREDLFEELGLDHECLNSIYEISADGHSVHKPEQAFDKIAKRTVRAMSVGGNVRMILWVQSDETGLLEPIRSHRVEKPLPRKPNYGLVGKCFYEERSQLTNFRRTQDVLLEAEFTGAKHIAVVPIKGAHGVIGAMAVWHEGEWNLDSRHIRLLDAMAAQTATMIDNDRLLRKTIDTEIRERELVIGGKIQESLLFATPPVESADFEFGLFAAPSQQVGGDFFEFFHYGSSCDVVIGDVMGKGVPAALVGAGVKGQFLRYARERRGDASGEAKSIVASVHREVSQRLINLECFITVCYARFDAVTKTMTYVDCGHPRPLHFRASTGEVSALEFDWPRLVNIPLGTHPQAQYEQTAVEFQPGDIFMFYSDGFTEAVDEDQRLVGESGLKNLIVKHNARHADEIAARIENSLRDYVKTGSMRDDLTCIVVKVLDSAVSREAKGDVLEIDARADQIPRLRAFLQAKCEGIPYFKQEEQQLYNLQLAVTEAATNIVKYAYKDGPPGKIRMQLSADNHKVDIKLFDTGCPFDPSSVPEPLMEGLQESGRGVYLIKAMMDQVLYLRDSSGLNCLHMVKIIDRRRMRSFE